MRDVAHVQHPAVDALDRQVIELLDFRGARVELDEVLPGVDFLGAGRQDEILLTDGADDVGGRETARPQQLRIEIDLHFPLLAAVGIGDRRAGNRGQLGAQDVVAEVEYLLLGNGLARQRELQDGHARGVVRQNERRRGAGRRRLQLRLRDGDDLRHRQVFVRIRLEEILDHRLAVDRLRFGVLDVVHHGLGGALGEQHDAIGDFLGKQPGVTPDHGGNRNLDVRKDVRGHLENRVDARNTISTASMMNVYGRRKASLTIHMLLSDGAG